MRLFLVVLIQSSYSLNLDTGNEEKVFTSQKCQFSMMLNKSVKFAPFKLPTVSYSEAV